MIRQLKRYSVIIPLLIIQIQIFGQSRSFTVSNDLFGCRVFVKNNGQYNKTLPNGENVQYAYVNGNEKVYFTQSGLIYLMQKNHPLNERQWEKLEKGKNIGIKLLEKFYTNMTWEGANKNIHIKNDEKQPWYHSFGDNSLKSDCYKKIIYENVYNNIDIEYELSSDQNYGIKYSVILHPGANIHDIKIKYDGDVKTINLKHGDVIIRTSVENIIEHAAISRQNNDLIETNITLSNNVIGFEFPKGYDSLKTIVIDPWVTSLSLPQNNYGYDVDFDSTGNYFVYGGVGPFLVSKYSIAGNLLWTFNGIVPSQNWYSAGSDTFDLYPGNFAVDKRNCKTSISQGWNMNGVRVIRLDSNGLFDNFISNPDLTEIWDMAFDYPLNILMGIGGSNDNKSLRIIDQFTGIITDNNISGTSDIAQDMASISVDPAGNIYLIYSDESTPSLNNHIIKVNSTLNGNSWIAPSTYTTLTEFSNKEYVGLDLTVLGSNGFNALASNSNYLYYYDGLNLAAYNKANGNKIGFTIVAGNIEKQQGGIAVDDCDNVYIGGHDGKILCYHFTGSSFIANGIIQTGATSINKYVFDVKIDTKSNLLYLSGSGFGGVYPAINSVVASFSATPMFGAPPLTSYFANNSIGATDFYWTFGNGNSTTITNPDNVFVNSGTYTVTLIASSAFCSDTTSTVIVVTEEPFINIPNVFTPNEDSINDSWNFSIQGATNLHFNIYNRWGNLVKTNPETPNLTSVSWDGTTTSGEKCSEGVYFYVVEYTDKKGERQKKNGYISLFR